MRNKFQQALFIAFGWFFVMLGVMGVFLPLLPTTVFLIIALVCFAKSSPRFHQMLLENRWFGETLRHWEQHKTVTRQTKRKATFAIFIAFLISIGILYGKPGLQILLVVIGGMLLTYIWRLNEPKAGYENANL